MILICALNWKVGPQEFELHGGFLAEEERNNVKHIYIYIAQVSGRKIKRRRTCILDTISLGILETRGPGQKIVEHTKTMASTDISTFPGIPMAIMKNGGRLPVAL